MNWFMKGSYIFFLCMIMSYFVLMNLIIEECSFDVSYVHEKMAQL